MITRHYAYSAKWLHLDGNGSYSFDCGTLTYKSVFPDSEFVYNDLKNRVAKTFKKDYPNGTFELTLLSRI